MQAVRLSLAALIALGCAQPACAATPPQPPEFVQFVLGEDEIGGVVSAPNEAHVHAHEGRVTIEAGERFAMTLAQGALDLQAEQARVIEDRRLRLREFVTHTDETLIWRWGPRDHGARYHFVHSPSHAPEPYHCRSEPGHEFKLVDIHEMLAACRSVEFR